VPNLRRRLFPKTVKVAIQTEENLLSDSFNLKAYVHQRQEVEAAEKVVKLELPVDYWKLSRQPAI
jgi:hypothetical protein